MSAPRTAAAGLSDPVCGVTWGWVGIRGEWTGPVARASLEALADTGANWVTLAWSVDQETAHTPHLNRDASRVVTDDEIAGAADLAHELGLKVCLKPVVNCADGTWRAYISFVDPPVPTEPGWDQWFAEYSDFIVDAAALGGRVGAEMLCVGCEMVMADSQERHWRQLVARVRGVYRGLVTYNCDKYQEDRLAWWDAVDVISSSGYYPSGTWAANLDRIGAVVEREHRPFVFMEAGCPSRTGSQAAPNDWTFGGGPDEETQARYLDEMFAEIEGRSWVGGVMLWDWPAALYPPEEASLNRDYCMFAKCGEAVVRDHFRRWKGA